MEQNRPPNHDTNEELHGRTRQRMHTTNWWIAHDPYIRIWQHWDEYVVNGVLAALSWSSPYMYWYRAHSRLRLVKESCSTSTSGFQGHGSDLEYAVWYITFYVSIMCILGSIYSNSIWQCEALRNVYVTSVREHYPITRDISSTALRELRRDYLLTDYDAGPSHRYDRGEPSSSYAPARYSISTEIPSQHIPSQEQFSFDIYGDYLLGGTPTDPSLLGAFHHLQSSPAQIPPHRPSRGHHRDAHASPHPITDNLESLSSLDEAPLNKSQPPARPRCFYGEEDTLPPQIPILYFFLGG